LLISMFVMPGFDSALKSLGNTGSLLGGLLGDMGGGSLSDLGLGFSMKFGRGVGGWLTFVCATIAVAAAVIAYLQSRPRPAPVVLQMAPGLAASPAYGTGQAASMAQPASMAPVAPAASPWQPQAGTPAPSPYPPM